MEITWDDLPNEMWIYIFSHLPMKTIISCRRVCRRFESFCLSTNIRRVIHRYRSGLPMYKIFMKACIEGDEITLPGLVRLLSRPRFFPPKGHSVLWTMGLKKAIIHGHIDIVEDLLSFGAVFDEKFIIGCEDLEMVSFLLTNFKVSVHVLNSALKKAQENGQTEIVSLVKLKIPNHISFLSS